MSWIESSEAKRIEFVNNEIKNAYLRELVTADQLVSLLFSAVESCEPISEYWFVSHDAIVVDGSRRITPLPEDPPVPNINAIFRDRLNEEQVSVIQRHLHALRTDKGILKEDLLNYLRSFEHSVRSICINDAGQSIKLATLPEDWTVGGFPQAFVSALRNVDEGHVDFDECLISLLEYRGESSDGADEIR